MATDTSGSILSPCGLQFGVNSQFAIALHTLGFLAARDSEPLTSDVLASTYGTTPVVLRRVLSALNRAGLVESKRGQGGGSVLARPASSITLRDALAAVTPEHEFFRRHPGGDRSGVAGVLGAYVNGLYDDAEQLLLDHLASITIAEMDSTLRPRICAVIARTRRNAS